MPPLVLSEDEVQQLQALASSRSLPHSIVQRAQIVLACGIGETNTAIAKRMGLSGMTVGTWSKCYRELGLEGLRDELSTGRSTTAPRKPDGYKTSTDPFFVEKVRDIVGLYLNPPDKAVVLCVDETTQIQALDRARILQQRCGGLCFGHELVAQQALCCTDGAFDREWMDTLRLRCRAGVMALLGDSWWRCRGMPAGGDGRPSG